MHDKLKVCDPLYIDLPDIQRHIRIAYEDYSEIRHTSLLCKIYSIVYHIYTGSI